MPTELDREKNLQHARSVAYDCILEYGIYSTTYEIIAKRSGLGVRTLRRYFRNKTELVCDVMKTIGKERYRNMFKKMSESFSPEDTGLEQLRKFHYLAAKQREHKLSPWIMCSELELFMYEHSVSDEILSLYLKVIGESRQLIKQILIKGIADGSIRSIVDIDAVVASMNNSFVGLLQRLEAVRYVKTDYYLTPAETQIDLFIEGLILYLKPPQSNAK